MKPETRSKIEALGLDLTPEMMGSTQALFAETFRGMDPATEIERDLT